MSPDADSFTSNPRAQHSEPRKKPSLRRPPTPLAYRPQEAGDMIGVGKTKIYELMERGAIEARQLDGATVILHEELERFLATLPTVKLGQA